MRGSGRAKNRESREEDAPSLDVEPAAKERPEDLKHELPELQRPEYERIRGQTTRVEDSESDEEDEDREIEKTDKEAEGEDGKVRLAVSKCVGILLTKRFAMQQLEGPHYTKVGRNYRLANGGTIEGQQRCSFCKAHGLLCVPATGSACAGCYGNRATKNTIGACNRK